MKNTISRTAAASIAAACLLSAASCSLPGGGNGSGSGAEKPKKTASEVIKHSYSAEQFGSVPDCQYVDTIMRLGDTDNILVRGNSDGSSTSQIFITDVNFEEFKPLEVKYDAGENSEVYLNSATAPDGTIYVVAAITDYGDQKLPDWNDPEFDYDSFNWDAFNAAATNTTVLYTFDASGKQLTKAEVELEGAVDPEAEGSIASYIGNVYPIDKDHALAYIGGEKDSYIIINADGTFGESVSFPSDLWLGPMCSTPSGDLAFTSWSGDCATIGIVNKDDLKVKADAIKLTDLKNESVNTLIKGDGEFDYYISTYSGLFGINPDGSSSELINWSDSDLDGDSIRGLIQLGNNEFAIYVYNYSDPAMNGFYRLTERDASEFADKTLITVAVVYSDSTFKSEVSSFNRSSDKYRIKINDYSEYYEWDEESEKYLNTPSKQLKLDIIAGNSPDMLYFSEPAAIKGLTGKGVFVDLYDFLGKDGGLSKDDLVPPVLKACEENGKLYSITPSLSMSTAAVKTKYCDKENWTIDDLIAAYNKLPAGSRLTQWSNSKLSAFQYLVSNMSFVDYAAGTCNYDSDEFVKILEFANQFPEEEEQPDWEHMTEEQTEKYYIDEQTVLRNDKALIGNFDFYDFREYNKLRQAMFGEDITLVGYPSANGCGTLVQQTASFAILSDSPNKDECWKFLCRFFTEDYQEKNSWSVPALKSAFEKKLDESMEDPYWIDENGEKHYEKGQYSLGDETIEYDNLSKEDRDYIEDLILNANVSGMQIWDNDVQAIVDEEVQAFFAGEKSAKETAEIIQNRVSILVSEQS